MKKGLIFTIVGLLVVAVLVFISINFFGNNNLLTESANAQSSGWLEVVAGKAFELETDQIAVKKELATGDYILEGMILKTATSGKAIIHYPDGSELRMENDTLIVIEKGTFDTNNDSLKVKIELVLGRTWSKIIELATPDSEWEVKTSNAVATVRGTAFGMEAGVNKKTKVFGSENKVQISMRNAKANKLVPTDLMVTKDSVVEISDEVANEVIALKKDNEEKVSSTTIKKFVALRASTASDLKDGWINDSEKRDEVIRTKVRELDNSGIDKKAVREKLREEVRKDFQEKIKQAREIINEKPAIQRESLNERPIIQQVIDKPLQRPIVQPDGVTAPKPVIEPIIKTGVVSEMPPKILPIDYSKAKIEVVTKLADLEVVEGTEIQFNAFAVFPDGTRKDVTSIVKWSVMGYIGKIDSRGKLISEIMPEASEYLLSPGTVSAVLENTSGVNIKGLSKLITVTHKPSTEIIPADIRS